MALGRILITLPIIFLCQKASVGEKKFLEKIFKKKHRSKMEFYETQNLIKKYDSITLLIKRLEML